MTEVLFGIVIAASRTPLVAPSVAGAVAGTTPPGPVESPEALRTAWAGFIFLTGLLVIFVLLVALLVSFRRRRSRRLSRPAADRPLPDPWREAGRRAEPYARPDDDL